MSVAEMRREVALRDVCCMAPKLDEHCGPCRDRWGNEMSDAHLFLCFSDGEMDYVRQGAIGRRHELACDHCWLCPGHHRGTGPVHGVCWATSHRALLREHLEPLRAPYRAPLGLFG